MLNRFKIRRVNQPFYGFCIDKWFIVDSYVRLLIIHCMCIEIDIPYVWFGKPVTEIKTK